MEKDIGGAIALLVENLQKTVLESDNVQELFVS